jgi:hypothetical protein
VVTIRCRVKERKCFLKCTGQPRLARIASTVMTFTPSVAMTMSSQQQQQQQTLGPHTRPDGAVSQMVYIDYGSQGQGQEGAVKQLVYVDFGKTQQYPHHQPILTPQPQQHNDVTSKSDKGMGVMAAAPPPATISKSGVSTLPSNNALYHQQSDMKITAEEGRLIEREQVYLLEDRSQLLERSEYVRSMQDNVK